MSAWTKPYWPRSGERGIAVLDEDLAPDEVAQPRLELVGRQLAADRRQRGDGEGLAEDRGILQERSARPGRARRAGRRSARGASRERRAGRGRRRAIGCRRPRSRRPSSRSLRTVSTAYSGIPSARARIARRARFRETRHEAGQQVLASPGRTAGRATAPRSCAGRRPSPGGARGTPAGRASRSGSGGRSTIRARWSMKSSRPWSAQWMSSNTRTVGPCSLHPLEERPPGGEQLLALERPDLARARAGRAASARSSAARPRRGRTRPGRPRSCVAGRRLVVTLGQAGPLADHLAERPERDALAVGGRAALVPVDVSTSAVDVLQELPGEAALADSGLARHRHEARAGARAPSRGGSP